MRLTRNSILVVVLGVFFVGFACIAYRMHRGIPGTYRAFFRDAKRICARNWQGYTARFIRDDGRVVRAREGDTVSEGQAYAMLRAVWMDDKETFDACYSWSEQHLSRRTSAGDNLLAWHWEDGAVIDGMPAADADIDYAASLLFAGYLWRDDHPRECEPYTEKARLILGDILNRLTVRHADGRLYLLPWIIDDAGANPLPQNPSYYAPAFFRVFYRETNDARWLELVDSCYDLLDRAVTRFGHPPDWCVIRADGEVGEYAGRSFAYGWEAVRVPFRLMLDGMWSDEGRVATIFTRSSGEALAGPDGEHPLFQAALWCVYAMSRWQGFSGTDPGGAGMMLESIRQKMLREKDGLYYNKEYFTESLAWYPEGIIAGVIRDTGQR